MNAIFCIRPHELMNRSPRKLTGSFRPKAAGSARDQLSKAHTLTVHGQTAVAASQNTSMPPLGDRPNFNAPWTDELFAELEGHLKAGRTIPEIAKIMGRSQEAIRNKAWRRRLLPPRCTGGRSSLIRG